MYESDGNIVHVLSESEAEDEVGMNSIVKQPIVKPPISLLSSMMLGDLSHRVVACLVVDALEDSIGGGSELQGCSQ